MGLWSLIMLVGISSSFAQLSVVRGSAITIDGKAEDWPSLENALEDAATGMKYMASHDDEFLYLLLMADQAQHQLKLMRNGMEIEFDIKSGKKKQKGTITYPYQREGESYLPQMQASAGQRPDMEYMKELFLLRNQRFFAKGFADKLNNSFAFQDNERIQMAISLDDNRVVMEYKIAKASLSPMSGTDWADWDLNLELTVKGITAPGGGMPAGGMGGAMGAGGGRGAMAGGARGGGGRGAAAGARPTGDAPPAAGQGNAGMQRVDMMNKGSFKTTLLFTGV